MTALYQRLKELSKDNFESLIDQILQARYPTSKVTRVNGAGGDKGIDSYVGRFEDRVAVWQDKHFPDGIGKVQKKQILKSIDSAFKNHKPVRWTLCVPIDLNPSARSWFDKEVVDKYGKDCQIELMQASHIVQQLLYMKAIREAFFPTVIEDSLRLREVLLDATNRNTNEIGNLSKSFADMYVDRLERTEPRLSYEVAFGTPAPDPLDRSRPNLLASVFDGSSRVNMFARDLLALQDDPIRVLVKLSREAEERSGAMLKTGKAITFEGGDILSVQLPKVVESFFPGADSIKKIVMAQNLGDAKPILVKMVNKLGDRTVAYPLVELKLKNFGTEQLTLEAGPTFPIKLDLHMSRLDDRCEIEVGGEFLPGTTFKAAKKAMDFTDLLAAGSELFLTFLETEELFLKITHSPQERLIPEGLRALIENGAVASKYLGTDLLFPGASPSQEDYELLETIYLMATGKDFEVSQLSANLVKDPSLDGQYLQLIKTGEVANAIVRLEPKSQFRSLFGQPISTGPMVLNLDRATLMNALQTRKAYESAAEGTTVSITLIGPMRGRYLRSEALNPGSRAA